MIQISNLQEFQIIWNSQAEYTLTLMGELGGVFNAKLDFILLCDSGHCTIVSMRDTGLKKYYGKYIKLFLLYIYIYIHVK